MANSSFRTGLTVLGDMGLSFEAWLYHPQLPELADLARAVPGVKIILNHIGGPIGIGSYADRKEEVFESRQTQRTTTLDIPEPLALPIEQSATR